MASDVDALFKLPLGEFTAARNALVERLKKSGMQREATETKALAKPSVSAWVVNQLYWRHGELFASLFEAGERLRHAQSTPQPGNSAREHVRARQEALAALREIAADVIRDGGYSATRDLLRRVTTSLEALSAYGRLPGAPPAGRLTDDVEPPGFEALTEFPRTGTKKFAAGGTPSHAQAPAKGTAHPRRSADRRDAAALRREEQRLATAARNAVREAEHALAVARKHAERAAAKLKSAVARAKQSEAQRAEVERRLAGAAKKAEAARVQRHAAEAGARDAAQAVGSSERTLELARSRLEQLARQRPEK
jgi:hypothetical protein